MQNSFQSLNEEMLKKDLQEFMEGRLNSVQKEEGVVSAIILPHSEEDHSEFAAEIARKLKQAGVHLKLDERNLSYEQKLNEAVEEGWDYVVSLGDKEKEYYYLSVREKSAVKFEFFWLGDFIKIARKRRHSL
ncbi:His/Gly/Thr/Pro-type tRNA ligase C-terminal domain-containing protein [Falsibacillus pallidus]|uniref:Anticodon tRNA-binding protein n=1 Tax=Falsibacillus pallidus TaxID=493781 RepID=A0A370GTA5_9BACI|nr:His/Gly/Thr/Pro-type tRNA ligase C-terminal domain-containing protein [Falsibacillus pallidus]RDI45754.1 anticodon tRNA-binding protein [Falsibacillus pallidus]